jgi:uncharacterized protein (TIRG00374 family)
MKDWRFWLGALISIAFIAFALSQIPDFHRLGQSLLSVRLAYLAPILTAYFLIILFRALRWQYLLHFTGPGRFSSSLSGIIICYFGNNILPLRAGDLLRAYVVGKRDDKSISAVLATVVVERLFDSLVILMFLAALLITLDFPESYQSLERALHQGGIAAIILAAGLVVFLYLLYFWTGPTMKLIAFFLRYLPRSWSESIEGIIENFIQGLKILGSPLSLLIVFLLSLPVWLVNLGPVYFVGASLGIRIPLTGCLLLLLLGAFSSTIPAAPGYWGTFHVITAAGIKFLGLLPDEGALTYAIVLHAIYFFPIVIIGMFVAWQEG